MERSSLSPPIPNSRHADPEGGQEGSSPLADPQISYAY